LAMVEAAVQKEVPNIIRGAEEEKMKYRRIV
jgi:hypothetical protein